MDAVKWYFRGFNRLVGEIGVRGPLWRRESQGCDGALTNSGSLKLHAPPWTLRGLSLNGPVPSASPQRRSPPRVFQPRHDPSARYLVKLRLSAFSAVFRGQGRYLSWPSPTQTASSDATHRNCTLQDKPETGNRGWLGY